MVDDCAHVGETLARGKVFVRLAPIRVEVFALRDFLSGNAFSQWMLLKQTSEMLSRFEELLDQCDNIRRFLTSKNVSLSNSCGFAAKTLINTTK